MEKTKNEQEKRYAWGLAHELNNLKTKLVRWAAIEESGYGADDVEGKQENAQKILKMRNAAADTVARIRTITQQRAMTMAGARARGEQEVEPWLLLVWTKKI